MRGSVRRLTAGLFATAAVAAAPGAAQAAGVWDPVNGTPSPAGAAVKPDRFRAFTLDQSGLRADLAGASRAKGAAANAAIVSLPAPDGGLQRFSVHETSIMEAGLAARHPEIKTYSGVGLDDPGATVAVDNTPLGFHASIRSSKGAWYVEPYYHLDDSVYVSYFAKDISDPGDTFVEKGPEGETDPLGVGIKASDAAAPGDEVKLRTFRLALVTDPSYATYFAGPANVTAAKVTLMNRVDQIYEDETAIRMVLVDDTDKLNLDTTADATGANGPCGAAPCYTAAQISTCAGSTLSRNRIVVGQIVGAGKYDIGHIGLGVPGGGVASLGVVGGNSKAQGCTGLPTPVGDFYAVDYVAHEMGHQFAGNHTFNGTQLNCSGGNRNGTASVEPGSGTSIMAYAGICQQDNLQPHSDPYFSQRSYDEVTSYTSRERPAKDEVQAVSLTGFDTNGDSFTLGYGRATTVPIVRGGNYTIAGITAALQAIMPAGTTVTVQPWAGRDEGPLLNVGFQVEFGGTFAGLDLESLVVTGTGASGSVGELVKGGPVQNRGFLITPTGNHAPEVTTAPAYTIPLRTPFALTGSATDADNDPLTYMWEQNDVGGTAGTAL